MITFTGKKFIASSTSQLRESAGSRVFTHVDFGHEHEIARISGEMGYIDIMTREGVNGTPMLKLAGLRISITIRTEIYKRSIGFVL